NERLAISQSAAGGSLRFAERATGLMWARLIDQATDTTPRHQAVETRRIDPAGRGRNIRPKPAWLDVARFYVFATMCTLVHFCGEGKGVFGPEEAEGRRQKAEGRRQKAEGGKQKAGSIQITRPG
ncbi:MAG TPA: hypothetical protein VMJ32_19070, partial [Pirellulales bacterium]|nr:hypothetical protein [Pirellulales bacterium]